MRLSGEVCGIWHWKSNFPPQTNIQNIICNIGEKTGFVFGHTWTLPYFSACLHKQETITSLNLSDHSHLKWWCVTENLIEISVHEPVLNSVALKTFGHRKYSSPALTVSHMEVIKIAFILHLPYKICE